MPTDNVIRMENGKVLGAAIPKTIDYSFEEHIIGTWVDGSILYEKTISCGALPNNTTKNVAHEVSNLNHIIEYKGYATNGTYDLPMPCPSSTVTEAITVFYDGLNLIIKTGMDRSSYNGYITLRYTKTN